MTFGLWKTLFCSGALRTGPAFSRPKILGSLGRSPMTGSKPEQLAR
ncbi:MULTISPECIES: hypothetical protein [Cyanophyceae]|nr:MULTISPECIES: hypothetical protein [Cyanophyceae]